MSILAFKTLWFLIIFLHYYYTPFLLYFHTGVFFTNKCDISNLVIHNKCKQGLNIFRQYISTRSCTCMFVDCWPCWPPTRLNRATVHQLLPRAVAPLSSTSSSSHCSHFAHCWASYTLFHALICKHRYHIKFSLWWGLFLLPFLLLYHCTHCYPISYTTTLQLYKIWTYTTAVYYSCSLF